MTDTPSQPMTQAEARAEAYLMGYTLRRSTGGDFRAAPAGGSRAEQEAKAIYADTVEDVLASVRAEYDRTVLQHIDKLGRMGDAYRPATPTSRAACERMAARGVVRLAQNGYERASLPTEGGQRRTLLPEQADKVEAFILIGKLSEQVRGRPHGEDDLRSAIKLLGKAYGFATQRTLKSGQILRIADRVVCDVPAIGDEPAYKVEGTVTILDGNEGHPVRFTIEAPDGQGYGLIEDWIVETW